jgi:hypothetical protein
MWIILFFLSLFSYSLESFERIKNVQILKTYPKNIILLNRGFEDGIQRNDHVKLINETVGYASRALCLKSSKESSYWKIYRVPNAQAFSKDYSYTIIGASDREMPESIKNLRKKFPEIPEENLKKNENESDAFSIKEDLPEKLTERDLISPPSWERKKNIVQEAFDFEKMRQQISSYSLSFYASPYTKQSINDGETMRIGVRGKNAGEKYKFLTQIESQKNKMKDPLTNDSITSTSQFANFQFIIHHLSPNFSSLSLVNYQATNFGSLGTPKSHYQIGPIGFTWHLYENKNSDYAEVSYIPLYDIRQTEIVKSSLEKQVVKTNGIRHGLRFGFKKGINERVGIENVLWVRPFQDPSTWQLESDNLNLTNDLKFVFHLSGNFYLDYNLIYQKDKLWKELNNFSDTNLVNSVNFRYDLNL